jgi:hypothetical protein
VELDQTMKAGFGVSVDAVSGDSRRTVEPSGNKRELYGILVLLLEGHFTSRLAFDLFQVFHLFIRLFTY